MAEAFCGGLFHLVLLVKCHVTEGLMTLGYVHVCVSFSMCANSSSVTQALSCSRRPAACYYNANVMDGE